MTYRPDYESADYRAGYTDGKEEAIKEWVGLSDREIMLIISDLDNGITRQPTLLEQAIARAIEQALKEKNNAMQ